MARRGWWVLLAVPAAMLLAGQAAAMSSCEGTLAATPLQPLPDSVVVGLDVRDSSPHTKELADRFIAGLKSAQVKVGAEPNVMLYVTGSTLGDTTRRTGPERSYQDMGIFQGGIDHNESLMPTGRMRGAKTRPAPPTLFIRAEATVVGSKRVAWVASIQCQRTGIDDGQLASDLGNAIGAVLGKRVGSQRL